MTPAAAPNPDEFEVEPIDLGVPIDHARIDREREAERDVLEGYARDDYPAAAKRSYAIPAASALTARERNWLGDQGMAQIEAKYDRLLAVALAAQDVVDKTSMIHPAGGLDDLEDALNGLA